MLIKFSQVLRQMQSPLGTHTTNSEYERPDRFYVNKDARNDPSGIIFEMSTLSQMQDLSGRSPNLVSLAHAARALTIDRLWWYNLDGNKMGPEGAAR